MVDNFQIKKKAQVMIRIGMKIKNMNDQGVLKKKYQTWNRVLNRLKNNYLQHYI